MGQEARSNTAVTSFVWLLSPYMWPGQNEMCFEYKMHPRLQRPSTEKCSMSHQ